MKRKWQLILFGSIHAFILLFLFNSCIYHNSSLTGDISLFFTYSSKIIHGSLPYHDFAVEYPPLAIVFFTLPRLVAFSLNAYHFAFAAEILIFNLLALFLLERLSRHLGFNSTATLIIYTVLILAIGPIIIYRFDLIPAVMVLASLDAFSRRKYDFSWVILAAGVMTKIYPIVIAPILLIHQFSGHRYKETFRAVALFTFSIEILAALGFFISPAGFWNSFSVQMHRGLQLESTYSSFLLLAKNLGHIKVFIETTGPLPVSIDVISPVAGVLAKIAPLVMILTLALIYWFYYRRRRSKTGLLSSTDQTDTANIINYSFLVIIIFILTSNVFSPQYLIWFFPLAPLITRRWRNILWLVLILIGILTYYEFPLHYNMLQDGNPQLIYVLLARNIVLIILTGCLVEWKQPIVTHSL